MPKKLIEPCILQISLPSTSVNSTLEALLLAAGATVKPERHNKQRIIREHLLAGGAINAARLARELSEQHGVKFFPQNVYKELKALGLKSKRVNKLPKKQKQPK